MNEFDNWRNKYETMSIQEQVEYHNDLEVRYPEQAHYNYEQVKSALELIKSINQASVLEFGCWKGDLANKSILEYPNIKSWKGIEICENAIQKTNCKLKEFEYIIPKDFNWFENTIRPKCDLIIATHFIEHISDNHFNNLVKYCEGVKYIYFEAPLDDISNNWDGYVGTHKLTYGWNTIIEKMKSIGYSELKMHDAILLTLNK
jgi:SAM-dependent methyltransferase